MTSPNPGQELFFGLPLGPIIKDSYLPNQHMFYDSDSIDDNMAQESATLNLIIMGMKFKRANVQYVVDTFMQNGCSYAQL